MLSGRQNIPPLGVKYPVNTMPAEALASKVTSASAGMAVLSKDSRLVAKCGP